MQTSIVPKSSSQCVVDEIKGRRVTYQITMRGSDGIVIVSDQRELLVPKSADQGDGGVTNMVNKIRFDPTGRFAWVFAGGKPSILAASYLERAFETGIADAALERTLRDCGDLGWEHGASGPSD